MLVIFQTVGLLLALLSGITIPLYMCMMVVMQILSLQAFVETMEDLQM